MRSTVTGSGFATPVALDRDHFMRQMIASLGHLNEGLLGSDVAGAYIMNVGLSMGAAIEAEYKRFWGIERPFTVDEYAHVIVDLKQKIHGNFSLVSSAPEQVVVRTTSCPFETIVRRSPSLCFMTSSVFGGIAARNFGYGKVALHKRIALGDDGCYVTVYLQKTPEAERAIGREYFPDVDAASPDIAEQLRLMDRLRSLRSELGEVQSRWDETLHSAAEAIAAVDAEGRVRFANVCWRELLGVEGGELVGHAFATLAHPDDHSQAEALRQRMMTGERVVGRELRLTHRDGSYRHTLLSGGPVRDEAGRVIGALLIGRDVTAERQAARLKDQFLATASHELRTPIASVKALAQTMLLSLERGKPIPPEQLADRLEAIVREADRLALLGRDLLDVSRAQASALRMDLAPADLGDVVAEAAVRHQLLSETNGARHDIRFAPAPEPLPALVDEARIGQALDNLLANASKYSPEGGPIEIGISRDGRDAGIHVRDRGIGIPPGDLPELFAPFARASNASPDHYPGLGLGLHLARSIVEAHGGAISLESDEGAGTTVTIRLPLATAVAAVDD